MLHLCFLEYICILIHQYRYVMTSDEKRSHEFEKKKKSKGQYMGGIMRRKGKREIM